MTMRLQPVADWVAYYLYDYTDMAWWRRWAAEGGSRHA